jgi:23S rRNA (adenine2503-C2)-methyltransferase
MGLMGNLSTAQVVEQIVQAKRYLAVEGDKTPLTNVVFMVRMNYMSMIPMA